MTREDIETTLRELFPYGHQGFIPLCLEIMQLHSDKNHDYASLDDPLGNFNRVDAMIQQHLLVPDGMALLTYMMKQVDAVWHMKSQGIEALSEGVKDRLRDIAVYALLMILKEREQ